MAAYRQTWLEGWRLFAVLAATLTALCLWIAGMRGFEVEGVRMVIRFTARTSLVLFCLAFSASYGPLAAFYAEAFETKIRYSGISFGYTIGTLAASAPTPIVAAYVMAETGSYEGVALFMVAMCLISVFCVIAMKETHGLELSELGKKYDPEPIASHASYPGQMESQRRQTADD